MKRSGRVPFGGYTSIAFIFAGVYGACGGSPGTRSVTAPIVGFYAKPSMKNVG